MKKGCFIFKAKKGADDHSVHCKENDQEIFWLFGKRNEGRLKKLVVQ